MTEEEHRKWDIRLQAVAPFITIAGILIGLWQFNAGARRAKELEYDLIAQQDSIEFKRKVWDQQLDTYRQVARTAGEVASSTENSARFEKAVREFESLYWGLTIFVEDQPVEEALHAFHIEIGDYKKDKSSADRLKLRSTALVEAVRASLTSSWNDVRRAE